MVTKENFSNTAATYLFNLGSRKRAVLALVAGCYAIYRIAMVRTREGYTNFFSRFCECNAELSYSHGVTLMTDYVCRPDGTKKMETYNFLRNLSITQRLHVRLLIDQRVMYYECIGFHPRKICHF